MAKKTKKAAAKAQPEQEEQTIRWHKWLIWIIIAVVIIGLVGSLLWFYSNRALPNVLVGNKPVSNLTPEQIKQTVNDQQKALTVTFISGEKKVTVPVSEVGVKVNADETVKQALGARKSGNIIENIALWQAKAVPLVFDNDAGKLKDYIQKNFPEIFVDAKDAQLVFNPDTNQFDIQPGADGSGFDIKFFESALPSLAKDPRSMILTVSTTPVKPLIQESGLAEVQKTVNQQLTLPLQFLLDGKEFFAVPPHDVAKWIHFVPDHVKGTVRPEYDKAAITQYITQHISPRVAQPSIDRKVIVDKKSGAETVIQAGRVGRQIQNIEDITNEIVGSLQGNQPMVKNVAVVEAPFKTITLASENKWLEIDLGQQTLTMWADGTAVQTFSISSGTARTPTRIGEFAIWYKTPSQTMTGTIAGDYYYLPNVKWVSYFDGEEAIHGTYWHNNFGQPMSHGCVNMTEAAAKIVYDFAPIGTKVIVHA